MQASTQAFHTPPLIFYRVSGNCRARFSQCLPICKTSDVYSCPVEWYRFASSGQAQNPYMLISINTGQNCELFILKGSFNLEMNLDTAACRINPILRLNVMILMFLFYVQHCGCLERQNINKLK